MTVATQAAAYLPPPPDLAIDMDTGEIGTRAELEAKATTPPIPRPEIVKPGDAPGNVPEGEQPAAATKPPPVVAPVDGEKSLEARQAEAAERLRARGAARRKRVADEATLRGHAQTLEQRLAAEQRARQVAEAAAQRDPLEVLKERGQVGKAFQQAAIDENTPEAKIARLERELAETRGTITTWQQGEAKRQREQQAASEREKFVQYATSAKELGDDGKPSDVASFPHVAAHLSVDREDVIARAERLVKIAVSRGHSPTWDQVLQELQDRYAKAAALTSAPSSLDATETPTQPAKPKAKGTNGARTLAAKTQERAVGAKRFEDMEVKNLARHGGTDEQLEYIAELARQEARGK